MLNTEDTHCAITEKLKTKTKKEYKFSSIKMIR